MCRGCRDDYYNQNVAGGCWSFPSATIVTRIQVGMFENPPYAAERASTCLSCYRPQGYAMLNPDDCRVRPRAQIEAERKAVRA